MNQSSLSQTYILGRVSWTITKRLMLLTYVILILSCNVGLKGDVAVYYSPPYEQKKSFNGLPLYSDKINGYSGQVVVIAQEHSEAITWRL